MKDISEKNYELNDNEKLVIAKYIILRLISDDKTVRDPVHGDILWNHLETCIIDIESFQRLRRIRQLGTTHFVYPGAEHSRFQHSIGTLYMAQVLLENVTKNERFSEYTVFSDNSSEELKKLQDMTFRLVVRASALLHDFYEFPLSHTLEKEGNIFEEQWRNKSLNSLFMGKNSEIFKAISDYIYLLILNMESTLNNLNGSTRVSNAEENVFTKLNTIDDKHKLELAKCIAQTIIVSVYATLTGKEKKLSSLSEELFEEKEIIEDLVDEKFLIVGFQIVANTICADSLDYLKRDFYFCGIEKTFDKRFLKYAVVCKGSERKKNNLIFGYRITNRTGKVKTSVLSGLFDLIELRYSLAELVHTHKTKNAFSVMAIESFNYYYESLDKSKQKEILEKILKMGDDELLTFIRDSHKTSKYILDYYFQRNPYKEFILWDYKDLRNTETSGYIEHLKNARERYYLESLLSKSMSHESDIDLQEGDFLIYVMPMPEKLYKELDAYILFSQMKAKEPIISTLNKLSKVRENKPFRKVPYELEPIIERIHLQRETLIKKYESLWCASLFLSPKIADLVDRKQVDRIRGHIFALIKGFFSSIGYTVNIRATEFGDPIFSKEILELIDSIKIPDARGSEGATFESIYRRLFSR